MTIAELDARRLELESELTDVRRQLVEARKDTVRFAFGDEVEVFWSADSFAKPRRWVKAKVTNHRILPGGIVYTVRRKSSSAKYGYLNRGDDFSDKHIRSATERSTT